MRTRSHPIPNACFAPAYEPVGASRLRTDLALGQITSWRDRAQNGAITPGSNSVGSYRGMMQVEQFGSLNHIAPAAGIRFISS